MIKHCAPHRGRPRKVTQAMATATKTETITSKVVDFSNVRDGGATFNKKRVPAGDYLARITKVQDSPAKDNIHQWLFTIALENQYTDRKLPYYCKLQENQLWKLRNLFLAAGKAVPKSKVKVNPQVVVGKLIGITLDDDEYEGKAQSVIAAVFAAAELEDQTDGADEDDEDDEEAEDTATDEEEDEEEDEEPAPAPKKKAAPATRAKAKPASKAAAEIDDEELEALDLDEI